MEIKQYDMPKFNLNEKIEFFSALQNYVSAEIPISTSLFQILEYSGNIKIRNLVRQLLKDIDGGVNFADSILRFKKSLGGLYCNLLSVGAQTGELPTILKDINDYLNKQRIFKANIIKSCTYPAFLLLMLIGAFLTLILFIQPSLRRMSEMNGSGGCSGGCMFLNLNFFILVPAVAGSIFFIQKWFKNFLKSRKILDVPIFGDAIRYYNLSSFTRLLAISYKAGIPITQAILLSAASVPNKYMSEAFLKCSALVTKKPIAKVFASTRFFSQDMIMKIESGDMSGYLDKVLYEISDTINLKLETAITSALKLLEPILIVLIGCAVGYYAYSLMGSVYGSLLSL